MIGTEPWVIVSAGFHFRGGQAKAVAGLATYLSGSGHPVHLVGHEFDSSLARPLVTLHRVPCPLRTDALGNVLLGRAGRTVAKRVTAADPAARVVVNGGNCFWADVNWVHYLHSAFSPDLQSAPHWFRLKERLVGAWYRRRERRAILAARLVLTNSHRTSVDVAHLGVAAERVRTIYYGVDTSWCPPTETARALARASFGLHSDRPVVVYIGGFGYDNRKGFDTLLTAWKLVHKSPGWDADLVLAGGGKAIGTVQTWIDQEGLGDRVRIVGFTDRVFDLLAASDLLVSPVRYEPYGLNVQEAVCRGVPALVAGVAGVAEEYTPALADSLLADANDAGELAARLRTWRADMAGWKARFSPLSARLRSRTWDDMSREIVRVVTASRV